MLTNDPINAIQIWIDWINEGKENEELRPQPEDPVRIKVKESAQDNDS